LRIESSVTAVSWIPSEAIEGMPKLPFELGIVHYDEPPPDRVDEGDLERLREADRFREANHLKAWIEVEEGRIVDYGHAGGGLVGSTALRSRRCNPSQRCGVRPSAFRRPWAAAPAFQPLGGSRASRSSGSTRRRR